VRVTWRTDCQRRLVGHVVLRTSLLDTFLCGFDKEALNKLTGLEERRSKKVLSLFIDT
jgi:hypothetical protein